MPFLLLSIVLLVGFLNPASLHARQVPITILCTTDLHAHVLPTTDYDGNANVGGLARCATMIGKIRAETANVLLVDAGDTIQGAPIGFLSDGMVMVKALNHLQYDAWTPGNHEFDWGLEKLAACVEKMSPVVLNANVSARDGLPAQHPATRIVARLKPYVVREVDGVKVALIGLNTPGIPNWSRPRLIDGLRFADSADTVRALMPELKRAGADVLVLVAHQGYREWGDDHANQINAIATRLPELDVIIGGHTHRHVPEAKINKVLYCQPGYHGTHLGRIDLVFDTQQRRLVSKQSRTYHMDASVEMDRELLKLVGEKLDRVEKTLSLVVGEATAELSPKGAPKRETPVHNLIFESIAAALAGKGVKVDAIVHGVLNSKAVIPAGPVTMKEVWDVVPYENTIGVAHLLPTELREVLDENAATYKGDRFRGIWGLRWAFDPDAPTGLRTVTLSREDGAALDENVRLAVAFNSYELASGGTRWKRLREVADRPEAKLVEYDINTRDAVADYIRQQGTIKPAVRGWWKMQRRTAGSAEPAGR